ncbi:hypothetical protein [Campylobacter concisus]|uniref:Uncharacterized protein n=1 Tax=Campylobacter concisus TaxID=199 RepID=A0A2R4P357_9BACT|nr:hypothetical protein [Campylobacter concisus]AVX45119.1 hypothetical protein CCS77_2113 [Campylobacter concisus]
MLAIMKDEFIEYAQEAEDEIFKRRIKKATDNLSISDLIVKITSIASCFILIALLCLKNVVNINFDFWYLCASFTSLFVIFMVIQNSKAIDKTFQKKINNISKDDAFFEELEQDMTTHFVDLALSNINIKETAVRLIKEGNCEKAQAINAYIKNEQISLDQFINSLSYQALNEIIYEYKKAREEAVAREISDFIYAQKREIENTRLKEEKKLDFSNKNSNFVLGLE